MNGKDPKINIDVVLKKYMHYVQDCEGINFLESDQRYMSDAGITDKEWEYLRKINKEWSSEFYS